LIKPGAGAKNLLDRSIMNLISLTKSDVIVVSGGANAVYKNNSKVGLSQITKFLQGNSNTNVIILDVPHRYDLVEFSCVNKEIQAFNRQFKKL
jgi:hypothetical protein